MTRDQELSVSRTLSNLSPMRVYQFRSDEGSLESCPEGRKCTRSHEFTYHGMHACGFRLFCSKMAGRPCGDYGEEIKVFWAGVMSLPKERRS